MKDQGPLNGEANHGLNPSQNWAPIDYGKVQDAITGDITTDRVMELLHGWRLRSLQLVIPPDCHRAYQLFVKRNATKKEPDPMPFDQWGVDVRLLEEPCFQNTCGTIIKSKDDNESSTGFERRHELIYGRKVLAYLEYAFLPLSEAVPMTGGETRPVWACPEWLPPTLNQQLGGLREARSVRKMGSAWVSLAEQPREPLIEAVAHVAGHRYPVQACRMKFLGLDKAGEKVVEVDAMNAFPVPVWVLHGELPRV